MAEKINEKELEEVSGGTWAEYKAKQTAIFAKIKLGTVACKNCGQKAPNALSQAIGKGDENDEGVYFHCALCNADELYTCEDFGVASH